MTDTGWMGRYMDIPDSSDVYEYVQTPVNLWHQFQNAVMTVVAWPGTTQIVTKCYLFYKDRVSRAQADAEAQRLTSVWAREMGRPWVVFTVLPWRAADGLEAMTLPATNSSMVVLLAYRAWSGV